MGIAVLAACAREGSTDPRTASTGPRFRIVDGGGGGKPTATFVAPSAVTAGASFTLALTDPRYLDEPADLDADYRFDCGSGIIGEWTTTGSATCVAGSADTLIVRGQIRLDRDNLFLREYSDTVIVTKETLPTQTITITSTPPSPALVGGSYTLAATGGGSGNAVVFASTTQAVCTVNGSEVAFVAAGTCVLAADQAGSAAYGAAPSVTQTVTVTRRPQQISFTTLPSTARVGTTALLAATGGASGQPVTFASLTPAVCTVDGAAVAFTGIGSCVVAADQDGTAAYDPAPRVTQTVGVGSRYAFGGFVAPVGGLPTLNVVRAGQAIPLQFSLGGVYGLGVLAGGAPASRPVSCDAGAPQDALDVADAPGGSGLTYDAATDRYTYAWRTEKGWAGTCRELVLTLDDGTAHTARFRFR